MSSNLYVTLIMGNSTSTPDIFSDDSIQSMVWNLIENSGVSVFLTGKAGTGKTTFLRRLVENSHKRLVITAPTGIAAINAGGVTLHSFFQLPFGIYLPGKTRLSNNGFKMTKNKIALIRSLDLLVIDEVSMVRADLLDAVDDALRRYRRSALPFGGLQLLLIGDLNQLPPVVRGDEAQLLSEHYASPYFFESKALSRLPIRMVELTKVYRQSDSRFLEILNEIRSGNPSFSSLETLNTRVIQDFVIPPDQHYIHLTTHNHLAREINSYHLSLLKGKETTFKASIEGKFPEMSYPADPDLTLKVGAQVMFIKNDPSPEKKYYNGLMGRITHMTETTVSVYIPDTGEEFTVAGEEWENNRYEISEKTGEIMELTDGIFRQIPLRLAWAVTVHKSQGLTFDRAIIDVSRSFAHGQAYVALSRCRTLEGIILDSPLTLASVITDCRIRAFMNSAVGTLDSDELKLLTQNYHIECLDSIFSFRELTDSAESFYRVIAEAFNKHFTEIADEFSDFVNVKLPSLRKIAANFSVQYRRIFNPDTDGKPSAEFLNRIKDAALYFHGQLKPVQQLLNHIPKDHPNKEIKQRLLERRKEFGEAFAFMLNILKEMQDTDFSPALMHSVRARSAVAGVLKNKVRTSRRKPYTPLDTDSHIITEEIIPEVNVEKDSEKAEEEKVFKIAEEEKEPKRAKGKITLPEGLHYEDLAHPDIYERLVEWRMNIAREEGRPAYCIATNRVLLHISENMPQTIEQLSSTPGIIKRIVSQYGNEILNTIRK